MATFALNSGLWVPRELIGVSNDQERYPASKANELICQKNTPLHYTWCDLDPRQAVHISHEVMAVTNNPKPLQAESSIDGSYRYTRGVRACG
jgi:hypothetical protein